MSSVLGSLRGSLVGSLRTSILPLHWKSNVICRQCYSNGITTIHKSCIFDNGTPYFYTSNNSLILLIECFIDVFTKAGLGTVSQTNKQSPFILALPFIETGQCVNIFDNVNFNKCTHLDIFQYFHIRRLTIQSPLLFLICSF